MASPGRLKGPGAANAKKISDNQPGLNHGERSQEETPWLPLNVVLSIYLVASLISATYATIPDCDEVFNYWEPAHYLSHGSGLQTWEYSPLYAIRSWLYIGLHSLAIQPFSTFFSKSQQFFILRCMLGALSAISQTDLYHGLSTLISPEVGLLYLCVSAPSAGMFQATPAFLPSSFAMYFVTLGITAFLRTKGLPTKALTCFSVAAILGWPFSLALAVPQLSQWCFSSIQRRGTLPTIRQLIASTPMPLLVLALTILVDSLAYRKLVLVPLNIVLYNVFGGEGKGPDLYGTEPWWYYFANLSLNFNITFILAFSCALFLLIGAVVQPEGTLGKQAVLIAPFYLWLGIFSSQPHKEERFMFPAYSALCINAAISLFWIDRLASFALQPGVAKSTSRLVSKIIIYGIIGFTALVSVSRVIAVTTAYSAPKEIYEGISHRVSGNVCFGKEWYRFPSSFFLPESARPQFIKSEFTGLLPGHFSESSSNFRQGTWDLPENMNDKNEEDYSKYVPISECSFLVDAQFEGRADSALEPNYIDDVVIWEAVACRKFLDAGHTPLINRVLWLPPWIITDRRVWGKYCLLKRRDL